MKELKFYCLRHFYRDDKSNICYDFYLHDINYHSIVYYFVNNC